MPDEFVNVRYLVDDVENAVALLSSGPASSAGRPMPDGRTPQPGGWNRIHLIELCQPAGA
jgi:hypothetical protein